ncbi:glycosyltransferase family 2 protein [Dehalococcoidia bacterium]|nr:glycosyltransferase family 2 protein [Dehalococcoidia bacterium]
MARIVSIIVVNYNGMPHVDTCISSLLRQTYPNFEIIFVDNASTDNSLDYARRRFSSLIIVANRDNLGYAGGINRGLIYASGEYIAPLNIDTEVDQNWLANMVRFLDENPKVGAVTPKILLFQDRSKINALGLNIHITGIGFARALNQESGKNSGHPLKVSGVSGCSYLIRRQILEQIGGINEKCFVYYDDIDLSWVINLLGYDMYCILDSVVYHKYYLKMNQEKFFAWECCRYALLLSIFKPATFAICFPALAFTEMLMLGYCLIRGKAYISSKLKALFSVYQNLDSIKMRRVQLQKLRKISDFQLLKRLQLNYEWGQLFHILK